MQIFTKLFRKIYRLINRSFWKLKYFLLPYTDPIYRLKQLARQALELWPLEIVGIDLIKYRENAVFKITTADSQTFALRIHRPGYHEQAAIVSELQWMAALADFGIDVPKVVPNTAGDLFVMAKTDLVPDARLVDLFEWVMGDSMRDRLEEAAQADNVADIVRMYAAVGEIMAQLHNQAAVWKAPAGFTRHAWDLEGLVGEQPFWGRFWELELLTEEQKKLMVRTRARIREDLEDYGQSAMTYGLIHADLNLDNVLVDEEVAYVIDFDDAGYGWHLFDLAITYYHIIDEPFELVAKDALLAGYRKHRPLSNAELMLLPMFMVIRACTYLGWVRDRQESEEVRERTPDLIEWACRLAEDYLRR
ncbi:MAG: Ser/Thr protein kinase RdoA (MazF antagonist) [Cellvibrionaceae bacterium]|jgi:Ser/Thr protein kinase RdoA (MazF antagonist)